MLDPSRNGSYKVVRRTRPKTERLHDRTERVVDGTEIIDTYEHLMQDKERLSAKMDLSETILAHCASSDLVSSGMPVEDLEKIRNPSLPLRKRWQLLKPYWEMIQNTGYVKAVNIAVRDLYGLEGITDDTYEKLASRLVEANKRSAKLGVYEWILKQKSKIEVSILCWLHITSPHRARQALSEWLDTVPSNKILGSGGDYIFAEGVYGHQIIARENIARVLTEKVKEDYFTEQEATKLARMLLRENAHKLFLKGH